MADTKVRLNQLDQVSDPAGGVTIVNKGGIDYSLPVQKILLAATALTDAEKKQVLDGLNTLSTADVKKLAPEGLTKYAMSLLAGVQYQGVAVDELQSLFNRLDDRSLRQSKSVQNLYVGLVTINQTILALSKTNEEHNLKVKKINDFLAVAIQTLKVDSLRESEQAKMTALLGIQLMGQPLMQLEGFDPLLGNGSGGSGGDPVLYDGNIVFPAPESIIKLEVTSASGVPTSKNDPDITGSFRITVDGQVWQGYCQMGVQGASSAGYPKKNLNLAFYSDVDANNSLKMKIGDIIPHDEWVFKANWIDQTQARNLLCYRLWDQIKATRTGWPKVELDTSYVGKTGVDAFPTGAAGHPVGYPCEMYFNGDFYGIGTYMIGKKRENYNISKKADTQIIIGLDDHVNMIEFKTGYEIRSPKKPTDATNAVIADWQTFIAMGQDDFTKNFDTYVDRRNIVDFYLFILYLNAYDCTDKNTLMVTWNGKKWFFMVYDLDTTLGLNWAGGSVGGQTADTFNYDRAGKEFWQKMAVTCATDLQTRYAEIRKAGLWSIDNIYNLYMDISDKYAPDMIQAEFDRWPTLPSWKQSTFDQISSWLTARLPYLDKKFNYTAS